MGVGNRNGKTSSAERSAIFYVLALTVVLLPALASGCGAVPMTRDRASDLVVNTLMPEAEAIDDICEELDTTEPGDIRGVYKGSTAPVRNALAEDADFVLAVMLNLLEVDLHTCKPADLAFRLISSPPSRASCGKEPLHACVLELEDALHAPRPRVPAKVHRAIRDMINELYPGVHDDASRACAVLLDPAKLRKIDTSPAVVVAFLQLADVMEDMADELSDSIDFVPFLMRPLLRQLAADVVAATLDLVVGNLERKSFVTSASVARSACRLYAADPSRGSVATRTLKRAILRFDPGQWQGRRYPMQVLCDDMRASTGNDVCRELGSKAKLAGRSAAFAPTLQRTGRGVVPIDANAAARAAEAITKASVVCELMQASECTLTSMAALAPLALRGDGHAARRAVFAKQLLASLDALKPIVDNTPSRPIADPGQDRVACLARLSRWADLPFDGAYADRTLVLQSACDPSTTEFDLRLPGLFPRRGFHLGEKSSRTVEDAVRFLRELNQVRAIASLTVTGVVDEAERTLAGNRRVGRGRADSAVRVILAAIEGTDVVWNVDTAEPDLEAPRRLNGQARVRPTRGVKATAYDRRIDIKVQFKGKVESGGTQ
jgi:hypothetical protein